MASFSSFNGFLFIFVGCLMCFGSIEVDARRLGGQKCTWGPSYWCKNIRQASACSATSHCINTVWNNNPYPQDNDDICKICKEMVKEARDTLLSNETQEELKEVFDGSCDLIPVTVVADYCKKLADEFIPELVETLASEMNPDTVCTVAGLCNSRKIDRLLAKYKSTRSNCDVCHEGMNKMSKMIKGLNKNDILDKGLEMCGQYMGSYSDACKLSLLENFEDLYEVLANHDDDMCEATPLCSTQSKATPALLSSGGDSLECQFCEKVIQHYVDIWSSNQTEEEFKQVLDSICRTLGQPDRIDRCLNIVDNYYIPFFNYLIHELNPRTACQAVGLCGPGGFLKVRQGMPVSVLIPFDYPQKVRVSSQSQQQGQLLGGYFMPQITEDLGKPSCVMCEFLMSRVKSWLEDGHTVDELEGDLKKICSLLPGSVTEQCNNLVDTYGPLIIQELIQEVEATEICKKLGLCPQNEDLGDSLTSFRDEISVQSLNPFEMQKKEDSTCATCSYVTSMILDQVRDKNNQDEIRNAIQSVCRILPSTVDDRCELMVGEYAEKVIEMISQNLSPELICIGLSLCPNPKPVGDGCVMCKFIIKELDSMIEDKHNEAEIKKALETLCNYLPNKYADKCVTFVDTYADMIINLIAQDLSPEEICAELGLCTAQTLSMIEENQIMQAENNLASQACEFCKLAITELDNMLEDKHNEAEIKEALEKLCGYLPSNYADQCKALVDTYTDIIIDMIAKDATPDEICQAIGLCDKGAIADDILSKGMPCELCEFAVTKLDEMIEDKNNEQQIKDALDNLCTYLPNSIAGECKNFVDTYTDVVIEMLTNDVTPQELCTELRLCSSNVPDNDVSGEDVDDYESSEESEEDLEDRPYCPMCEYIVGELDRYMTDNHTEEYIQETVEQICNMLSGQSKQECKRLVDTYTSQIVTMLVSEYTPEQVCAGLGLCDKGLDDYSDVENEILSNDIPDMSSEEDSSEESLEELDHNGLTIGNRMGTAECALCEFAMNLLEKQILTNRTLDMVERSVLMICSYMPGTILDKCEEFVNTYGDEIIQDIIEMEMNPDEVCASLGMCTASAQSSNAVASLPGKRCAWGREYWCQSLIHARACGTVDYCNQINGENNGARSNLAEKIGSQLLCKGPGEVCMHNSQCCSDNCHYQNFLSTCL